MKKRLSFLLIFTTLNSCLLLAQNTMENMPPPTPLGEMPNTEEQDTYPSTSPYKSLSEIPQEDEGSPKGSPYGSLSELPPDD